MAGKLITILDDLIAIGQDELLLSDGATTWAVWCLRDAIRACDNDDTQEYSFQADGIWTVNSYGYLDKLVYGLVDDLEQ